MPVTALLGWLLVRVTGATPVFLDADAVEHGPRTSIATGSAVIRTDELVVRADRIEYDREAQRATATGNVLAFWGSFGAFADAVTAHVATNTLELTGARVLDKHGVSPKRLREVTSREELVAVGRTGGWLTARRIRKEGRHLLAEQLRFNPCDCGNREPWWISASHADILPGNRAIVSGARLQIRALLIPVPYAYVPLGERRSGLLLALPGIERQNGWVIDQPIFITLGRSYDVTLTPGYVFGSDAPIYALSGLRGPRVGFELRYAPSEQTRGQVNATAIYDLRTRRSPQDRSEQLGGARGLRGELQLNHHQSLPAGFRERTSVSLASDGHYVADARLTDEERAEESLRSTAEIYRPGDDSYLGLSTVLLQDLGSGDAPFSARGPATLQRVPELQLSWLPTLITPHFAGSADLLVTRHSPLFASEREGRDRLGLSLRAEAPFPLGEVVRVTPMLGVRQHTWLGEDSLALSYRAYGVGGTHLATRIEGDLSHWARHIVQPSIELRYLTPWFGRPFAGTHDVWDSPGPAQGALQSAARVGQRLVTSGGRSLRLDVGQAVELDTWRPGETDALLEATIGFFSARARAQVQARPDRKLALTWFSAATAWQGGSGQGVELTYDAVLPDVEPERMRRAVDVLVASPPVESLQGTRMHRLGLTGSVVIADAWSFASTANVQRDRPEVGGSLFLHEATVRVTYSPCRSCWRASALIGALPRESSYYVLPGFTIDGFASFGGG